jgi:hypothetical protein
MIIYRPVAPLTAGRPELKSALAAMALTAFLGTSWQVSRDVGAAQEITAETAGGQHPDAAGPDQP